MPWQHERAITWKDRNDTLKKISEEVEVTDNFMEKLDEH